MEARDRIVRRQRSPLAKDRHSADALRQAAKNGTDDGLRTGVVGSCYSVSRTPKWAPRHSKLPNDSYVYHDDTDCNTGTITTTQ